MRYCRLREAQRFRSEHAFGTSRSSIFGRLHAVLLRVAMEHAASLTSIDVQGCWD